MKKVIILLGLIFFGFKMHGSQVRFPPEATPRVFDSQRQNRGIKNFLPLALAWVVVDRMFVKSKMENILARPSFPASGAKLLASLYVIRIVAYSSTAYKIGEDAQDWLNKEKSGSLKI
jgi:hypothetical protein